MTTIRTYQTVEIHWARGARWTGYQTVAEAEAVVARAAERGEAGEVVRRTFEVEVPAERAHLYRPGIAERVA